MTAARTPSRPGRWPRPTSAGWSTNSISWRCRSSRVPPANPNGLAFDLVHLPGQRGLTGHLDGVVTVDLAEADPVVRDELRRYLNEPYRTLIGNLRHEIAHHYWPRLVGQSDQLTRFRALFGDERVPYAPALERHYATPSAGWDEHRFVTRYAQAHPHEDWAETFADYLHISDLVDTAAAHGLVEGATLGDDAPFELTLQRWRPLAGAFDHLAHAVGAARDYPVDHLGTVVDKLEFVHARIPPARTTTDSTKIRTACHIVDPIHDAPWK